MQRGDLRSDAGISLVEIMVAMFIVGLASSFVVLNIPRTPTPLEEARRQVEDALITSARLADIGGEPRGVKLRVDRLELLVFRDGEWRAPNDFNRLKDVEWDEEVRLTVPETRRRPRPVSDEEEEDVVQPDIWFDPTGIATAKQFDLSWKDGRYRFTIDQAGDLDVQSTRGL